LARGKKKDQFPDAAAMLSLAKWCDDNKEVVYIVSQDGDLKGVCDNNPKTLIYQEGVAEFLDAFNRREALANYVQSILKEKAGVVKNAIKKQFESAGFILHGECGDVEDVLVFSVKIENPLLVTVEDHYAIVEMTAHVECKANVSYADSNTGYYDNEDDRYYFRDTVKKTIRREISFEIEVEIEFDVAHPPKDAELTVDLGKRNFNVDLYENHYEHV